jgi:hypothetical protein
MSIRRWTGPLLLAAILAAAALAVAGIGAPALPRTEPRKTEFSAERAWRHVEEIARAPHPVGTAEHDRVRSYVLRELEDLGLEVDTLSALSHVRWGSSVRSALTRNVMARLPGAASTGAVVLVSHYDGAPLAPAAGDAGIGVATVLEAARALAIGDPTRNDVIFLLTDAEELGSSAPGRSPRSTPGWTTWPSCSTSRPAGRAARRSCSRRAPAAGGPSGSSAAQAVGRRVVHHPRSLRPAAQ